MLLWLGTVSQAKEITETDPNDVKDLLHTAGAVAKVVVDVQEYDVTGLRCRIYLLDDDGRQIGNCVGHDEKSGKTIHVNDPVEASTLYDALIEGGGKPGKIKKPKGYYDALQVKASKLTCTTVLVTKKTSCSVTP